MPTYYTGSCYSRDYPRWERCRKAAADQMIAEGWKPYARKFSMVQRKRAIRIWNAQ